MQDALGKIQAQTLDVLRKFLKPGDKVALADFPGHENAGDSLIYLGEKSYLRRLDVQVRYLCDFLRYDPATLRRRMPEGPILLQGGGNLGDRWLETQDFREQVIRDFPDRRIVQLPQSLEFTDPVRRTMAQKVFGAHPDLTILARDTRSLELARATFTENRIEFCPDMALGVGYLERLGDPSVDVLMLLRIDSEAVPRVYDLGTATRRQVDWGLTGADAIALKAVRAPGALARRVPATRGPLYRALVPAYEAIAWLNVHRARRVLAEGRVVLTDRLHASVLSFLSRVPVVALDNVYGKISSIYADYLKDLPGIRFAKTAEEAAGIVQGLVRAGPSPGTCQ